MGTPSDPAEPAPFLAIPLDWRKLFTAKKQGGEGGGIMGDGLPVTEPELIRSCQREYEEAAAHGGQEALDACFRLSWALVHSRAASDVGRGVELAEALADTPGAEARDLRYLVAVGRYRQRHHIEARKLLKALLLEHPEFRQAEALLELCDKAIVRDGMVGLGAGAAIAAVAAVAIAVLRK